MTGHRRVRLYHQLRSAHLERAAQLPPATIVYGGKRYDFDDNLAAQLDLVQARGWRAAWFMMRNRISVLEINEPLMLFALRSTAVALLGLRLRQLVTGSRTRVVAYAIENLDPSTLTQPVHLKNRIARRLDHRLAPLVWRRLDRVAFGTEAAQHLYRELLPQSGRRPVTTLISALPAPAPDADAGAKDPRRVLFLGAFVQRKGFHLVMRSWPRVRESLPDTRLTVVGQGALQPLAEAAAASDASVDVWVDPPREQIRELLRSCQILVLPSQPSPSWREQVGLPIVEGLSYGCTIVTTTETGLASWLTAQGHRVLSADADAEQLADAIISALRRPLDPSLVLAGLPAEDGRLAADAWLFADLSVGRTSGPGPIGPADVTERAHV